MANTRVVTRRRAAAAGLLTVLVALGCDQIQSPTSPAELPRMQRVLDQDSNRGCSALAGSSRVVIDASRDGGAWWFPQAGPFSQDAPHQGQALAEYFRSRGFAVDELGRGTILTDEVFLGARAVIRTSGFGHYSAAELEAYRRFLSCPATLVLLAERSSGDQLAELLGLTFPDLAFGTITDFVHHPLTQGVTTLPLFGGTTLAAEYPSTVQILARFGGLPIMGVVHGQAARVLFLGDVNSLETVPQPFVDNLIAWGF
jgi:hypothetical protein